MLTYFHNECNVTQLSCDLFLNLTIKSSFKTPTVMRWRFVVMTVKVTCGHSEWQITRTHLKVSSCVICTHIDKTLHSYHNYYHCRFHHFCNKFPFIFIFSVIIITFPSSPRPPPSIHRSENSFRLKNHCCRHCFIHSHLVLCCC